MKNKIVIIILGCALTCSIGLNIFLFHSLSATKGQVSVFSDKVVTADNQVTDLQNQLSGLNDLQDQVEQLEEQLADNEEQIATLENAIAERENQIKGLETALAEGQATIEELEKQQIAEKPVATQQPAVTPAPQQQQPVQQPVNPMPGGTMGDVTWGTPGDGSGADGDFGGMQ